MENPYRKTTGRSIPQEGKYTDTVFSLTRQAVSHIVVITNDTKSEFNRLGHAK
jgi:hypothetical protein